MATDQALRTLILAANPVGYYPLDTLANLGRDLSTYANNGSQSGTFRQAVTQLGGMDITLTQGVTSPAVSIPDRAEYKGRTFTVECIIAITDDANLVIAERGTDSKNWSLQSVGNAQGRTPPSFKFVLGPETTPTNGMAGPVPPLCHMVFTSVLGVTKVYLNGQALMIGTAATGSGTQANQGTLPLRLFSRGTAKTGAGLAHMAFYNRALTAAELQSRADLFAKPYDIKITKLTATPANQEPRSQFQPQDVAWRGSPQMYAGPVLPLDPTAAPLCQGQDLTWLRDGNQTVLQGYIESTVTIDGVGVRRRVLCFDQAGNLIGETMSRASDGKYRFDLLWLNKRYMLVAQDDPAFGPADYNAVAADYQLPTPYAPGEGVGLSA